MNEEESFVFIYPKRLVLIQKKWCDFCNRQNKEYYIKELVYLFGYQFCKDCEDTCQQQVDIFCRYKKEYSTNKFIQDFDLSRKTFDVKRSSGVVEHNWKIDHTQFIKVRNGDYLIPMSKLNVFKYVDLVVLYEYNKEQLDLEKIQTYFSEYFY